MSVWFAVLLGLTQGCTEFLPISSSAHLSLLQLLFPRQTGQGSGLTFDALLHLATLAAVCTAYRRELRSLLTALGRLILYPFRPKGRRREPDPEALRLLGLLLLGTLPLGLALLWSDLAERLCGSLRFLGIALAATGCLLHLSDRLPQGRKPLKRASAADALLVGLTQAVATLPGLSRSGCTVTGALARGFDRASAVKFSFLLSIPAILGANLAKLREVLLTGGKLPSLPVCALGMLAALVSGILSIRAVRILSRRGGFSRFRWYCWGLGLLSLLADIFLKG